MLAASLVGPSSESGRAILEGITKLSKLVPPGSVSGQDKLKVMQQLTIAAQKQGQQMQMMRQGGAPAQQPGQPPAAPPQMPRAA